MPSFAKLPRRWALAAAAFALGGCSIHPIPDDVSRYSTAEIVRNVRCEAKDAVRERIREELYERHIYDVNPEEVLRNRVYFERVRRRDPILAARFKAFGISTITYEFEFEITEDNNTSGDATFTLPFAAGGKFSLLLEGQFDKKRYGKRTFVTVETFADLVKLDCKGWVQPDRNMAYPLTGSIGIGKVINTFINISTMGSLDPSRLGDEKSFTDLIKFTTVVGGSSTPILRMDPIPDRVRVTSATIQRSDERKDVHQVTVSLLFPDLRSVREVVTGNAAFGLTFDAEARALENSCVATERAREDRFGMLRRKPPAIYCRPDERLGGVER